MIEHYCKRCVCSSESDAYSATQTIGMRRRTEDEDSLLHRDSNAERGDSEFRDRIKSGESRINIENVKCKVKKYKVSLWNKN